MSRKLDCSDYHVAWICPVADIELLPARLMLDEEYPTPPYDTHYDENTYICGSINGHTIVVATCPPGQTGNVNAGRLTGSMFKTFLNIRMAVLVGIGGGIPSLTVSADSLENIHLGDVVVGWPGDRKPACIYHDSGRSMGEGQLELMGTMQDPDWRLLNALGMLLSDNELGFTEFDKQLARLHNSKAKKKFAHPGLEYDKLFKAAYRHDGDYGSNCTLCNQSELVQRPQRSEEQKHSLVFHQGRIASGTAVIQDGIIRDQIRARCGGPLCVEMEAAGVDVNRRCLVIRGISDYADTHKNDLWRSYAAGNAAAFARELLLRVVVSAVPAGQLQESAKVPEIPSRSGSTIEEPRSTKHAPAPQTSKAASEKITKIPKSSTLWSSAEDEMLLKVVQTAGSSNWKIVAQHFHRDDWACRKRYEKLMGRRHNA